MAFKASSVCEVVIWLLAILLVLNADVRDLRESTKTDAELVVGTHTVSMKIDVIRCKAIVETACVVDFGNGIEYFGRIEA